MPPDQTPITSVSSKGPHAQRRFTRQLAKVQMLLDQAKSSSGPAGPAEVFFQNNARTPLFMLEALGRVYENLRLDDKLFPEIRQESKIIEDALGNMDFWKVVSRQCQEWSLPQGAVQLALHRYHQAAGRTWAWIESQDWLACRYHADAELRPDRFVRKLRKVDWHSPKKEARLLRGWLREELLHIHESVQRLDLRQIEAGLHKARREVRWISIYFTAVEGAFVLDQRRAPPGWDRYLTKEITANPYNQLPVPEPDDVPISVPAPLLYALSYFIDRMGVIKDRAQGTETARQLLAQSGEKPGKPLNVLMGENYLEDCEATKLGRELIDQVLIKDRLLPRIADSLNT